MGKSIEKSKSDLFEPRICFPIWNAVRGEREMTTGGALEWLMRALLMLFLTGAVTSGARWLMAAQRTNAALPTLFEKRTLTLSVR